MDKSTPITHGRIEEVYKDAPHLAGFPAVRHHNAEAKKPAAKDKAHLWESAFHAERGCLSGGISPRHPAQLPRH